MNASAEIPPLLPSKMSAPDPKQALRRLFMTLFLRGRGARGLNQKAVPTSVSQKLAFTLFFYALFGCLAFMMMRQSVFALAVYLHAMTFAFLGMFVAASAGEILFNKEEADILLHRPIEPRAMLWAKIRVLVEVSLWIAAAFNLAGLFAGLGAPDGGWRFPIAHIISTTLEALFCTGCVVLAYQLCLRWFGRERLEGLMTTAQVFVSVAAVLSGQILPRLIFRYGNALSASESSWWIGLLPPAWFAGFDDAFAGSGSLTSWVFAAMALLATGVVLWLAFGKLAHAYETGLQAINETGPRLKPAKRGGRWIDRAVNVPPLSWWLRDPVSRASFLLTTAYIIRDRDVKLRLYPGVAPILIIPFIFLFQKSTNTGGFGTAFSGAYLGLIPLIVMSILQYSQQWQASDVFRSAPMRGPAAIYNGARRAVICFVALPLFAAMVLITFALDRSHSELPLLLPGVVVLPVYSLVPGLFGRAIPLSRPIEEGKAAGRGLTTILVMFISMGLAAVASILRSQGWFWPFLLAETIAATGIYIGMRYALANVQWRSAE